MSGSRPSIAEKTQQNLRKLHFEFSSKFPPSVILHLQGSAALLLRRRMNQLKGLGNHEPSSKIHLSPVLLANPTEILVCRPRQRLRKGLQTNAPLLIQMFEEEIDRNSEEKLKHTFPPPIREHKGARSGLVPLTLSL